MRLALLKSIEVGSGSVMHYNEYIWKNLICEVTLKVSLTKIPSAKKGKWQANVIIM